MIWIENMEMTNIILLCDNTKKNLYFKVIYNTS